MKTNSTARHPSHPETVEETLAKKLGLLSVISSQNGKKRKKNS